MQYYLVLDNPEPGFDAFFESSAFPDVSEELEALEKKLKIKNHFEFFSYEPQNDLCPPGAEETEVPWFEAKEGVQWLGALIDHLVSHPTSVQKSGELVNDFQACREVLQKAAQLGAKWHFEMDI